MKIIHITVARQLTAGQIKQMNFEKSCAERIDGVEWEVLCCQSAMPKDKSVRRIPFIFRGMFLRNLYAWLLCLYYSKLNDYVILRHITFDPFGFVFAPFVNNRASIHHAKEINELRIIKNNWIGKLASALESLSGRFVIKRSILIIGVTKEIAEYEKQRIGLNTQTAILPNGVDCSEIITLDDNRSFKGLNIAFVCGSFSPWHGLDILIDLFKNISSDDRRDDIKIHLIGYLTKDQYDSINCDSNLRDFFIIHGPLSGSSFNIILSKCDIGLGSMAMFRQDLLEGSTLKVRELLGLGLPIYSGHIDAALPADFLFYRYATDIVIKDIVSFAVEMKKYTRDDVRALSLPYIQKDIFMREISIKLSNLNKNMIN